MDYANRIKKLRLALGLSQRELAEKFKVRHTAISQWESGARKLSGPVVVLLEMLEKQLETDRQESRATLKKIQSNAILRTLDASKTLTTAAVQSGGTTLVGLINQFESGQALERKMWEEVANNLVSKLGEFKGLYMKLGQIMSYLPFVLPQESRSKLASLQTDSTPLDPRVIEKVIETDFGKRPSQLFKEWEPLPFSAASIGQVHRARLRNGKLAAVKVQYPNIKKAIKADLANALLVELMMNVVYRRKAKGTLLKEMKERFLQECDYELEAVNQQKFRTLFARDPYVKVPEPYLDYCSKHVFTSEFCEGTSYYDFAAKASEAERRTAAETLYRFAYQSIFKHRLFNCDPHPGNYRFDKGCVVFLDFGCVKKFKVDFITLWVKQQRAIFANRLKEIDETTIEMGLISDLEKFDFDYHRDVVKLVARPVLEADTFRFTPDYVEKTWRTLVLENPNRHYMNLPGDWLFSNRLQWGLFSILAGLNVDIPCRKIFLEAIGG